MFMSIKFQQVQNHLVKSFVIEQIITSLGGAGQSNKCCISCSYMEFQVVGLPFLTQMNLNYNQFSLLYQLIFVFMLAVFCIISLL